MSTVWKPNRNEKIFASSFPGILSALLDSVESSANLMFIM